MRALTLSSFDGPDAAAVTDTQDPVAGPGELLLAVEAAAVGAWDTQSTRGAFAGMGGLSTFPQVLGWDVAGTVLAVGDGVPGPAAGGWAVGDAVFGFSAQPWTARGTFAERVALDAGLLARRPAGLSAADAAALPVTALTADLAVRTAALAAGDVVLVLGAAGGVGSLVVQLARAAGARVLASVSPGQADDVLALGADAVVDRTGDVVAQALAEAQSLAAGSGRVDVVIDLVGPGAWSSAVGALRPGGRFVTSVPLGVPDEALGLVSSVLGVQPDPARLAILGQQVVDGTLRQRLADVVPLSAGVDALGRVERGGVPGKVVLDPSH